MRSISRRRWIAAVGLLLCQLGSEARAQVVTADRLELAPTTTWQDGLVYQDGQPVFHTWDASASSGQSTNLYLGRRAGNVFDMPNHTGSSNTGVGTEVLYHVTSGGYNTALGAGALYFLEDGSSNTAIGSWALSRTTSGSLNTAVGSGSLNFNTTGSYNASIDGLSYNTTGSYNTAMGRGSLFQSNGDDNSALGFNALLTNREGSRNTAVGAGADVAKENFDNATAIGAGAIATSPNMVRIGDASVTKIEGQVPFSWVSDRRWKVDVEPLALGLDFVRELRPVSYRLKGGNGRLDLGFVAQDVEAVLGDGYNLVSRGGDDEQLLSMRYTDLVAPLVKALQELDARQRSQEETMAALHSENAALARQVEALRTRLAVRAPPAP